MGNQQSGSTQFCSRGELYTERPQMTTFKHDPARVGYDDISTKSKFQVQRIQKPHQQIAPQQQQIQEEIVEIPLSGPGKWTIPKSFFETEEQSSVPETRKPTFNVYISCLKEEEELPRSKNGNQEVTGEILEYYKDDFSHFDGVFGNVIVHMDGRVLYTDITGEQHCDDYDRETVEKIFPMGIAFGGLTKSIWFNDGPTRDEAFEKMISMPPSYRDVMANPAKYALPKDEDEITDDDNMKIFEGLNNSNVIVHSENLVLYTDLNKKKHCVTYNKRYIKKCFPKGICFGGLPKVIWFKNAMERDLCFMLMQWNLDEDTKPTTQEPTVQNYTGLNGGVVLHPDSQIEYTSLMGDRIKCFYEPSEILETFPMGISYGRLPKTIWFQEVGEREECIKAMRSM